MKFNKKINIFDKTGNCQISNLKLLIKWFVWRWPDEALRTLPTTIVKLFSSFILCKGPPLTDPKRKNVNLFVFLAFFSKSSWKFSSKNPAMQKEKIIFFKYLPLSAEQTNGFIKMRYFEKVRLLLLFLANRQWQLKGYPTYSVVSNCLRI